MPDLEDVISYLSEAIPAEMSAHDIPGVAVGLCDADSVRWARGFGSTGGPHDRDVDTQTMFSVQSTSKLVTATGVLLAVQNDLVDLDEPIKNRLPDFTVRSTFEDHPELRITLRQLLDHTAGFTHETRVGSNYLDSGESFEEHIASIGSTFLRFPVGHHHEYSNLGIDLAGYIVQQAAGTPFVDYMSTTLLGPLGMSRSTYADQSASTERNRAIGHSQRFAAARTSLPVRIPMVPAGGLYTTVDDELRYVQLHLREGAGLLDPATYAEHLAVPRIGPEQTLGYGLCLYVDEWSPGVRVLHHGGAGFGFLSQVFWLPDLGVGAVILTNSVDHNVQNQLAAAIVSRLGHDDGTTNGARLRLAPGSPRDAAGAYLGRLNDVLEVTAPPEGPQLHSWEGDEPDPSRSGKVHQVLPDQAGRAHYLRDLRNGEVRHRTVPADSPPSHIRPERLGRYDSRTAGVVMTRYRIRQAGNNAVIDLPRNGALDEPITLLLQELEEDLYLSSTGETLDFTGEQAHYANIPLFKVPD
ncbi:MAG: beta-lactamase family protein [Actinomycetia bacterium]|nr:beta-lactamase family protein [Actinomycetes bacterium]